MRETESYFTEAEPSEWWRVFLENPQPSWVEIKVMQVLGQTTPRHFIGSAFAETTFT